VGEADGNMLHAQTRSLDLARRYKNRVYRGSRWGWIRTDSHKTRRAKLLPEPI